VKGFEAQPEPGAKRPKHTVIVLSIASNQHRWA